ncbi:UNVERIFIED_CONTAM: hypothetical protein FKN15_053682 [Acipenser sinensis]
MSAAGVRRQRLKIHQGRMKCLREKGQGPHIDQYFLRSQSSQSNEIQRQEANHSSQDISTPVIDVRRTCMDTVSDEPNDPCEPGQTNQHKREKNLNGHKPGVKWPRACEKTAWDTVNTDLCVALERLSGTVEKKLDKFGDIIYAYGSERFGVEKRKEKVQTIPGKSRRQQEIERLVRERRQLRKQWRRAEQSQKEGLNLLQRVIKDKLATLRRAERLRKRYKKKERARANFYKDPFKFVKKLFTSEKNGTLKASKCTHLDARRFGARRSGLRRSVHAPRRFGASTPRRLTPRRSVHASRRSVLTPRRSTLRRSVHAPRRSTLRRSTLHTSMPRRSVHAPRRSTLRRIDASALDASTLGARVSTLGAHTSTLDASAFDTRCTQPRRSTLRRIDARCTHLDARRLGARRLDARCTHLDARRLGARRLDARCTHLDARRLGARRLDARCTHLDASMLGARTSTLDASALDARCTHLDQPCPGFTVVLPARLSCQRVIPMRTA